MASQPAFTFGLDWLDRPIITSAKATTALINPLEGLHSRARRDIILSPLSREERRLMKMSRSLPFEEQRVVMHWMLVSRTENYIQTQEQVAEQASKDRAADIVEDERRRTERHATSQARLASKAEKDPVAFIAKKPELPIAAKVKRGEGAQLNAFKATTYLKTIAEPEPAEELDQDDDRDR